MLADFFGVSNQPIYHIVTLKMMLRLNNGVRDRSNEIYSGCLFSWKKIFFSMCVCIHSCVLIYKIFYYI